MGQEEEFTSKLVRTTNCAKELMSIASHYKLSTNDLDMRLINAEIYLQRIDPANPKAEVEFVEATAEERKGLNDVEMLSDPNLVIKQVLDVDIFKAEKILFPKLNMSISGNKTLTSVYAVIKAGSQIEQTKDTLKDLTDYFIKRKLRANIIINLWDAEMHTKLSELAAKVDVHHGYTFEEDTKILIAQSLGAKSTKHDKLTLHFNKEQEPKDETARIDYKQRGFIKVVEQGELLITYEKPQEGANGRNCRGVFIQVPPPDESHVPKFGIDEESIEIREDDDKIEYFSKKNGYIDLANNTYLVKEDLEVSEISFKTTGSVNAGLEKDVSISVKENDAYKDAIGMGVNVEASEINVEGSVGPNSTVSAKKITIGGQTHKSSVLTGPDININVHKGLARGKKVEVRLLEGGRIEADEVYVQQTSGGEIYAKDVVIEVVASHLKVVASHSITIKKLRGSENSFRIDPTKVGENIEGLESLDKALDDARIEMNVLKKKYEEHNQELNRHTETIKEIQSRLAAYKKAGAKMPKSFVEKYKEFQTKQAHVLKLKQDYRLLQDEFEMLTEKRKDMQGSVMDASIINHDIWRGYNDVSFRLTNPDMELNYSPKEGLKESVISLKYNKEKETYEIVASSTHI